MLWNKRICKNILWSFSKGVRKNFFPIIFFLPTKMFFRSKSFISGLSCSKHVYIYTYKKLIKTLAEASVNNAIFFTCSLKELKWSFSTIIYLLLKVILRFDAAQTDYFFVSTFYCFYPMKVISLLFPPTLTPSDLWKAFFVRKNISEYPKNNTYICWVVLIKQPNF